MTLDEFFAILQGPEYNFRVADDRYIRTSTSGDRNCRCPIAAVAYQQGHRPALSTQAYGLAERIGLSFDDAIAIISAADRNYPISDNRIRGRLLKLVPS